MLERPLRILQVTTSDSGGGAEKIAWDLFRHYRSRGHRSWLAVGSKRGDDPDVVAIPRNEERGLWRRFLSHASRRAQHPGAVSRLRAAVLRTLANPRHELRCRMGLEDFDHPGTREVLRLVPEKPDIIHCHNLHGGYFDLRFLPALAKQLPVLLTLHDAWLLSGHCAHSFDCERWKIGCGQCPDLNIYPDIHRDATAYNWRRKQRIFSSSKIFVTTPSRWLMNKVEQSLLWPSIEQARVIPNGIDLRVFRPASKPAARAALSLPHDVPVLLFAAHQARGNVFKDFSTLERALEDINQRLLLVCLGEEAETVRTGATELRFVPFEKDPVRVARYYQAADIYVHASRADTFPCSVLEALACATPVIATAVGGIPEQIKGMRGVCSGGTQWNSYEPHEATGILVPPADPHALAHVIQWLLEHRPVLEQLARNASADARRRFDIERQAERHLKWYAELQERYEASSAAVATGRVRVLHA